ncbi:MSCRAMM family protein, partial [Enterococcus hirae]
AGPAIPTQTEVVTDQNGLSPKIKALNGVHVKATEVFVPNPYVLGSAIGDSDIVEGDIVAGQTITLTQRNKKAKGQIIVEKSGVESGKDMWNGNYSLAGNVFEVRKDSPTGEVIRTITTDANGHAETNKELPLGTYVVIEKTASNGFANTFKPVEVKIEYANQTTAVIVKGAEGTNQEVVGSTLLTKEDVETGKETQGRATFDGAQYGLFHKDGTPVKWSENFKPTTSKGNKLEGDEVKFELSDKEQQASIEHLALGDYYWEELVAPEGYQLDRTKREFSITYKDQETKVIETQSTSKENVIKFSLDGFKYVDSKSGDTKTGYNGIDFTLTPIDPTKGEQRKVTTETDENGYDGYWAFNEVPYGDYKMSEVKAPEGYKTIKDLIINSKFDAEKREYTFTITEDGQKEPIKTLTVPEAKINEGSNVIHLSKLFLTNKVKEMPTIRTKATVDGEKTFTPSKETPMQDVAT